MRKSTFLLLICNVNLSVQFPQKVVSHILYNAEETTQTFLDFSSCVEPTIFWKKDGKCYPLGERGPCKAGEILIFSRADYAAKCTQNVRSILPGPDISSKTITTSSQSIKTDNSDDNIAFGDESEPIGDILENDDTENSDEICNRVDQIFWPEDGNCYSLLDQGPCPDGQWLILNSTKPIRAKCSLIPCPVGEQVFWSALCQCIDIDNTIRSGRYSPLEVCGERSRMVLNPYGEGECACEVGFFKDNQGICHALGSQGPCDTGLSWELVSDTVECVDTREGLEVRVFDLIPHDQRRAEVVKCFKDSKGNCRQTLGLNINRFGEDGNGSESDFETFINNYPVQAKANCAINPCKEDMIPWINGSCYQIASTGPCTDNQWLVLDQIIDDRPVLRCKEKKCSHGVWWEESCSCVQQDNEGRDGFGLSPCGDEGYTLLINPYGAGVCTCQDGYILDQGQKCAKNTEGDLTRFIDLRKDLQDAGLADIENCFVVNNGICTKTIKSELDLESSSRNSLAELVNWMGSFPPPAQQCTREKGEEEDEEEEKRDEDEDKEDEDDTGIIAKFGVHSLDCSQDNEVEYNGECVKIFSSSVCPNQTQWIVMKKEKNTLVAVCQDKPCKNNDIFYQKDCKCHGVDSAVCGLNEDLYINIYGYGMCTCKPNHAVHSGDGKCYPIYSTGPCTAGSMFVPSTDLSGTCKPTICTGGKVYLNAGGNDDPVNVNDPDKDKNCFAIGDSEPCDDDQKVGIDEKFEITCIEDPSINPTASNQNEEEVKALQISPTTCILDSRGRCRRLTLGPRSTVSVYSEWLDSFLPWAPYTNRCTHV